MRKLMLGHIVNDEFVPLTVTDTAGGRKLEQCGWVQPVDNRDALPYHPDVEPEWYVRRGYVPSFRETT